MPLGAFRLNGLGKVQASAAVTYPVVTSSVATGFTHPYIDYSRSTVCYVGPDTSNRPVFAVASGSSNNLRVTLFRINTDTTITEGSVQTTAVSGIQQQVSMASEYEDANVNGAGSGDYIYMVYNITGTSYVRAASVSRDALTVTFGTAVSLALTPDANQNYVAYVGNSRCVAGARTGSGSVAKRYSRSGTTLTSEGTATGDMGFRIDSDLIGFLNNGTTQYRYGWWNTQSGASGTHYGAGEMGATNYLASNTSIASSSYDQGSTLNSYNKMIGLNQIGGTWYIRAVNITWNAASAATLSAGTSQSFTDVTGSGGQAYVIHGHQFDEAYVLYASSSSTIDYRRITVDGTTTTLGSKVSGVTGLSSLYYQLAAAPAQIGVDRWVAGYYVRSSGNPYLFAMKLQPYIRSPKTFVPYFNAQISTAQSVFGSASALFDGSGDYIQSLGIPAFGTSAFTVECRIRFTAATATGVIFDSRGTSGNSSGFCVYVNSSAIRLYHTGSDRITSSSISLNTWYHLAITRSGNDHKMWLNGTQTGSTWTNAASWTIESATTGFWIGDNQPFPNIGQGFNGYMDELRISSICRYTGTFTPSSTAFTNDADTICLLHMNGANASTVFADDSAIRASIGLTAINNAQVDTAQSKFGGASLLLDGSGDALIANPTTGMVWGTGSDFTYECFVRFNSTAATYIFDQRTAFGTAAVALLYDTTALDYYQGGTRRINYVWTPTLNTWYHVALVRNSGTTTLYVDGVARGSFADTLNYVQGNSNLYIGGWWNNSVTATGFNGWIDEVRVSSIARYTSGFTPTTSEFTNDSNTILLVHCNGTDATTTFTDDNA